MSTLARLPQEHIAIAMEKATTFTHFTCTAFFKTPSVHQILHHIRRTTPAEKRTYLDGPFGKFEIIASELVSSNVSFMRGNKDIGILKQEIA